MKFHHVGVACRDINKEIETISKLHDVVTVSPVVFDDKQNAHLCIITTGEGVTIELVAGEQVANLVKKKIAYYHICFETDDLDAEIARLRSAGALLVSKPKEAILFDNRKVAFLQASYGLIELLQAD